MLSLLLLFLVPLGLVSITLPAIIFASNKYALLDYPDSGERSEEKFRKIHTDPISRLGGIAIILSFFAGISLAEVDRCFVVVFLGGGLMFAIGLLDDVRPLRPIQKLFLQFIVALAVCYSAGLGLSSLDFGFFTIDVNTAFGTLLSAIVIITVTNSINMIDGMDGLAAGVSLIGIAILAFAHYFQTRDAWIFESFAISLFGSILGFLRYNTFPAKIFMGDGGSHWLGYVCGMTILLILGKFYPNGTVFGSDANYHSISVVAMVAAFSIPIVDTIILFIFRIQRGDSPFVGDARHVHHTLRRLGLDQTQSVISLYFTAYVMAIIGILPMMFPQYVGNSVPYFAVITLFGLISYGKFRFSLLTNQLPSYLSGFLSSIKDRIGISTSFSNVWASFVLVIVGLMLVGSSLLVPFTHYFVVIRPFFFVGFVLLTILSFSSGQLAHTFSKYLTSLLLVVILFLVNQAELSVVLNGDQFSVQKIYNAGFIFLAINSCIFVVFSQKKNYLEANALDFLMISLPLGVMLIPSPWSEELYLNIVCAKSLVALFCFRVFIFPSRLLFSLAKAVLYVVVILLLIRTSG